MNKEFKNQCEQYLKEIKEFFNKDNIYLTDILNFILVYADINFNKDNLKDKNFYIKEWVDRFYNFFGYWKNNKKWENKNYILNCDTADDLSVINIFYILYFEELKDNSKIDLKNFKKELEYKNNCKKEVSEELKIKIQEKYWKKLTSISILSFAYTNNSFAKYMLKWIEKSRYPDDEDNYLTLSTLFANFENIYDIKNENILKKLLSFDWAKNLDHF